jgi:signal transduction histidine kinase
MGSLEGLLVEKQRMTHLHQLLMRVLLFQHDSSDQRERVISNRAIARIGCGPAALRVLGICVLVATWLAFAEWQRREYDHHRDLSRSTLERQAEFVANAIASSIQSHRWFGPYVEQQLPRMLQSLATWESILAVAVVADASTSDQHHVSAASSETASEIPARVFSAGDHDLLDLATTSGSYWTDRSYVLAVPFQLTESPPPGRMQPVDGAIPDDTRPSFGPPWMDNAARPTQFKAIVVLDRLGVDRQSRREAWHRTLLVVAGGMLLVCVAVAWRATVRLAGAKSQAKILQTEARHLRELGLAAAGLAHETRNPLGLIRGWTQRLVDSGLPTPEQQKRAEAVLEECDRVTARINQFLAFARPSEHELEAVDVHGLIQEISTLLESDLAARRLRLDTHGVTQGITVQADRGQLRQILFNLLQNAIAFAAEAGTISIGMSRHRDGTIRVEVADDGPGPEPDKIESLFEPYFTTRPNGTGLGLAIVHRIATAHDWSVGYQPREGGGAIFWIDGIQADRHDSRRPWRKGGPFATAADDPSIAGAVCRRELN